MSTGQTDPWFITWRQRPGARQRLVCLPFAGGGASAYRLWTDSMPEDVEIISTQLPGRENRIAEPAYTRMNTLVDRLTEALLPHIDRPYTLFGHSMGAGIAFELAKRLSGMHDRPPERLLVSGRSAPHRPPRRLPMYDLPNDEFHERLLELNGTPPEVLEHPELMEILLPMLRADFELDDTYRPLPGPALDCPIKVYGGRDDPEVDSHDLDAWTELTTAPTTVTYLPGTHFFINEQRDLLLKMIGDELNRRAL